MNTTLGKFQYVKRSFSRLPYEMTKETFNALIDSDEVRTKTANARAHLDGGNKAEYSKIKSSLPAVQWCGVDAEFKSRKASDLTPTGLFMVDIDHIQSREKAEELYREIDIANRQGTFGLYQIMLAHITPSGRGLRIVSRGNLKSPAEDMCKFLQDFPFCEDYGDFDLAVHDYARLSFLVPRSDFLYIDEQLFEHILTNYEVFQEQALPLDAPSDEKEPEEYETIRKNTKYNGCLLTDIVKKYLEMKGTPEEGSRHLFYNNMVKDFRNLCNNSPKILHAILPRFGNSLDETLKQCQGITRSNNTTTIPKDMYLVLVEGGFIKKPTAKSQAELDAELFGGDEEEEEEQKTEGCPVVLPPVFREFCSICPQDFIYPTITALLPVMGTLTSYLRADYMDNVEQSTTFFSVIYAPPSSGKSYIQKILDILFKRLHCRDEVSQLRELIYNEEREEKSDSDKAPKNPHTSIRIMPAINSQTEFLCKMRDNKGYHMFTSVEEVDTFNKGTKAAGGDKSDLFRIAWDNGIYGQAFKGSNTFKGTVKLYYNILLTGTYGQVRRYYRNVENGMVTRVNFCELENQQFSKFQRWKKLSKKQLAVIDEFVTRTDENTYLEPLDADIEELREMDAATFKKEAPWEMQFRPKQHIKMDWIFPTINQWLEEQRGQSIAELDEARDTFRRRAALKGMRLAMICTQLWKTFGEKQKQISREFVKWCMTKDIEQSLKLFGELFNQQMAENAVGLEPKKKYSSVFKALPEMFNKSDLRVKAIQNAVKTDPRHIISVWKREKYVSVMLDDNGKKYYKKLKK